MNTLAPRHARFVAEYEKDWNGTRAAIRAGFAPKSAHVRAYRLKRRADVRAAIAMRFRNRKQQCDRVAARVLEELARIAFLDPVRCFYPSGHPNAGRLMPLTELDPDVRACVARFEVVRGSHTPTSRTYKVSFFSKLKALRMLTRRFSVLKVLDDRAGEWEALAARLASIRSTPYDPAAFLPHQPEVDATVGVQ